MTRRITLPLGSTTTETHCGDCPQQTAPGYCDVFGNTDADDVDDLRHRLCRAAEVKDEDKGAERVGRAVLDSGFTVDDAEAVRTIYSWAGNGASRIVECMRAIAAAMEGEAWLSVTHRASDRDQ